MSNLIIHGGKPLSGTVRPSGNKNSVLPLVCATLLSEGTVTLKNVPDITDIRKLVAFFESMGSRIQWNRAEKILVLDHSGFAGSLDGREIPRGMRSSVLLFPPLLYRLKRISMHSNVKGCALGVRELDPHLEILGQMGTTVTHNDLLELKLEEKRFKAARYWQDYMSVTTTENFVMAAVLADGESVLINAASEPHVQELCRFLVSMGARIEGIGTSVLEITGVKSLWGVETEISSDHHEIATFLALGAITGGEVRVEQSLPRHFALINRSFAKLGVTVEYEDGDTAVVRKDQSLEVPEMFTPNLLPKIEAAPWPYFPVDLLPPMVALAARADGVVHFWNKVYEGGFVWIPELVKFGAHVVTSDPHRIIVFGNRPMRPAVVEAPYIIRAAVALYMAGASIEGRTIVKNAASIRRAHPFFVENLQKLGADVEWDED